MAGRPGRRGFGFIRKLPSGRYQASYVGPDNSRHSAPTTYDTRLDAEAWVASERRLIAEDRWQSPAVRARVAHGIVTLFGPYSDRWLERRVTSNGQPLKPRTRAHYRRMLDEFLLPEFSADPLDAITLERVEVWHHDLGRRTGPTYRAHAYSLLRTILGTAVHERKLSVNPCQVPRAGKSKRVVKIEPATLDELAALVAAMPERYRALVLLSSWCGLRYGEAVELRRRDVELKAGVIHVRRGVTWVDGQPVVGTPKSDAGTRDVHIPPHLVPALRDHVAEHCAWGRDGLLFPARSGGHLSPSSLTRVWYPAREAAGRPDLRWHDLRHTGAVLAAAAGASLAELMGRLGHSTPAAALNYQHSAAGRDAAIAAKLSEIAGGAV